MGVKMALNSQLINIKEASEWATSYLRRNITSSNISYLIQYGRIKKIGDNGDTFVNKSELIKYYNSFYGQREISWKEKLGSDLNWHLSFDNIKEAETTKHVHRLHPYKGKFIPQLVEYFLDTHTDEYKKETFFKKGDIVLDPFAGSGTTLVQANELGIHAIGIDISAFNSLIANVKLEKYELSNVQDEISNIVNKLNEYLADSKVVAFEEELLGALSKFNAAYFPPDYKYKVNAGKINEYTYGAKKETEFLPIYRELIKKYRIKLKQDNSNTFLDKWYIENVRKEIEYVFELIKNIKDIKTKKTLSVILSRTMRSCRATTHADLATLKEPIIATYYCSKHGKVCKPLFSILNWLERYSEDTINRLTQFGKLRTNTYQVCLTEDSKTINITEVLEKKNPDFAKLVKNQKIKGIFTSPPYVGLIDYHEQHSYAYDLFGFKRKDNLEIGPLSKGQGREAQESYIIGISEVLNNCKKYMIKNYDVFIVANDKNNLYPQITEKSGMKIINQFKRPVLNRTEKDKGAYSEIIFHLKEK